MSGLAGTLALPHMAVVSRCTPDRPFHFHLDLGFAPRMMAAVTVKNKPGQPNDQFRHPRGTAPLSSLRACLKMEPERRVRTRGLQELGTNTPSCRPGPLIGRIFKLALSPSP
jgi:hypothetical protein